MNHRSELENSRREAEREARRKKWDERGKRFWSSFLFTENGKPKSALMIYTFSLSVVFIAIHLAGFHYIVDLLTPLTESWPVLWGNLLGSLSVSALAVGVGCVLHRLMSDKRLMFGTYLWLALYVAASIVTMAIMLRGTGAMPEFMIFALWFLLIPLALGLLVFYLLYRRDHHPAPPPEAEPEWKKYVRRS